MKCLSNRFFVLAATLVLVAGCSQNEATQEDVVAPQTGSLLTEDQIVTSPNVTSQGATPVEVKKGAIGYVTADSVRIRKTPETADNVAGRLSINDAVEILDAKEIGPDAFLAIRVQNTTSDISASDTLYIAKRFLSRTKLAVDPAATSGLIAAGAAPKTSGQRAIQLQRLFIVTNIATEKLRVYQRCAAGEGCVNRMIMEADVVNGEAKDGTRTNVGYFQVSSWTKFYETGPYPAWFKPGYPDVPKPGNRSSWFSKEYMPGGRGDMRGAFGWYTAKVSPNASGQWTHGTAGWGADKKDFIMFKNTFFGALAGLFTSIRSHGCTRIDNESIAYIRQLIAVGTPLIKIYAKEVYRNESRLAYNKVPAKWSYILTKNGHQGINNHQLADRETVLRQGTPQSEWIDQGTLEVDQYPDVGSGDLYSVGSRGFQGSFVVDEGTLLNYRHPTSLKRGGMSDMIAPPYMMTTNAAVSEAKGGWGGSTYQRDSSSGGFNDELYRN